MSTTEIRFKKRGGGLAAFSLPAICWYMAFTIGPLVAMFYIALLVWPGLLADSSWAGLDNFRQMFADPLFQQAAWNTFKQVMIVVPIMIPCAFMLGYYLTLKPRFHRVLKVILFTPALISLSAMGTVFYAVFQPTGMINAALDSVGLHSLTTAWMANPSTALYCIMFVNLWSGVGYTAILFSARLSSVGLEIYEAAELDGCGHWRRMWSIAFPMIRDYVGVLTMLQFLWVLFNSAGLVLLLTKGNAGTTTLSYLVYSKAFVQSQVGYSQAVGVVLFVVGVAGMTIIRRLLRASY